MKQELLSIGEVAKMKGVGVKSLRYYERVGVLKPAYVDEESGYRYYSMNQMIDLDLILSSIELDIPLRELKPYLKPDGSINVEEMLGYGRDIAIDHLRKAESALTQIDDCLREIKEQQEFGAAHHDYTRRLKNCYVLFLDWERADFAPKPYVKKITDIYLYAKEAGLTPLYRQGMLRLPGQQAQWRAYVEVAIPKHLEQEWLAKLAGEQSAASNDVEIDGRLVCNDACADDRPVAPAYAQLPNGIKFAKLPDKPFQGSWIVCEGFVECFQEVFRSCANTNSMIIATEIWNSQLQSDSYVVEVLSR